MSNHKTEEQIKTGDAYVTLIEIGVEIESAALLGSQEPAGAPADDPARADEIPGGHPRCISEKPQEDDMPRKQRFKPSRKPKPMIEAVPQPMIDRSSSSTTAAGQEPGPREGGRHEVHPDDVESERIGPVTT